MRKSNLIISMQWNDVNLMMIQMESNESMWKYDNEEILFN